MLRPVGSILYVFLHLLSKKFSNLNPYSFSPSPRSFSLGTSLEAIFVLSFLPNHSEASVIQLSSSVLTKKNAVTDMTNALPIFSHVIYLQDAQHQAPFLQTKFLQSQPHCLPLLLFPYQNLQSTALEGDKRAGVREYTPLLVLGCSAVPRGVTTENWMLCFPIIAD